MERGGTGVAAASKDNLLTQLGAASTSALTTGLAGTRAAMGIVEDGNTATHTISKGQYVIWKGVLYTADAAIASGTTLAASGGNKNLTAVSGGGLNALNSKIVAMHTPQTLLDKSVSLTTSYASTEETITVPSTGLVTIRMEYNGSLPVAIGLKVNQVNGATSLIYAENANQEVSVGSLQSTGIVAAGTYYVWGKVKAAAENKINVRFYPLG